MAKSLFGDEPKYFNRKVGLYLGDFENAENKNSGLDISELDFDFEVSRSIEWFENCARFSIYNPNEKTLNAALNTAKAIIFEAGYESEMGVVFIGNIYKAYPEIHGGDIVLRIIATSTRGPHYQLVNVPICLSYDKGASVYEILQQIADYTAMPLIGAETAKEIFIDEPFVFENGNARDALRKLGEVVWELCYSRIYFDNGMIVFLVEMQEDDSQQQNINQVYLSYKSGLISCIPVRDESESDLNKGVKNNLEFYFTGDITKWKEENEEVKETRKRVNFTAFLSSKLVPNTKVMLNTEGGFLGMPVIKDKEYLIHKSKFTGNNYGGEFKVECEAVEP